MQDKDIDSLFRSKLDNLEVEPSAQVWSGIASQMNQKKKLLGIYLSIAASLLILLSAGLYFVSNTIGVNKKPVQIAVAKNNKPVKTIIQAVTISPKVVELQVEQTVAVTNVASRKQKRKVIKQPAIIVNEEASMPTPQLAQIAQKADAQVKFTVPDRTVPLSEKIDIPEDALLKTNTSAVQPQEVQASRTLAAAPVKKHRIRNFGDLINAVVSKVDKRKDKLIEFSSPKDEDESTLSGLNLGFIKIKKTDQ